MGWFLGYISHHGIDGIHRDAARQPDLINEFSDHNGCYLAYGGSCKTLLKKQYGDGSWWIVLGLAVHRDLRATMDIQDWEQIFVADAPNLSHAAGPFVAVRYRAKRIDLFTDSLGLRTLYLAITRNGIVFSTRMTLLAKAIDSCSINHKAVGARWYLFNQMSNDALLSEVVRLGPNGFASATADRLDVHHSPWKPSGRLSTTGDDVIHYIDSYVKFLAKLPQTKSLGFSGGIDSRILLSLFQMNRVENFATHTFAAANDPDAKMARAIAQQENFPNVLWNEPLPPADTLFDLARCYIESTNLLEPASTILRLRYYPSLLEKNVLSVDGAYGELARRQYFNRIAVRGINWFRRQSISSLMPIVGVNRPEIFSSDYRQLLISGAKQELSDLLSEMPSLEDIGLENFLDLWAIRTRIPHITADEQARVDCVGLSCMPFAHPDFFDVSLSLPLPLRRNGVLFRSILRSNSRSLARYPLVKMATTYPFNASSVQSWLYIYAKRRLGLVYRDDSRHLFLQRIREYVFDLLHSESARTFAAYDYKKVDAAITRYYQGERVFAEMVDWWLTFEIWRRGVNLS